MTHSAIGQTQKNDVGQISFIKSEIKLIDKQLGTMHVKRLPTYQDGLGNPEIIVFLRGNNPVKVVINQLGEKNSVTTVLYYEKQQLIYANLQKVYYQEIERAHSYESDERLPQPANFQQILTEEDHHYFRDGKMIRWLQKDATIVPHEATHFNIRAEYLLDQSLQITRQLNEGNEKTK